MLNSIQERVEPLMSCGLTGILRAANGIEGLLPIVHGPMNCASGHRSIPLQAEREPIVPTTVLTDIDLTRGTGAILKASIKKYFNIFKPQLIVVILTCSTSLTSEYLNPVLKEMSNELSIPILELDGSGLVGDEVHGYNLMYEAISEQCKEYINDHEQNANLLSIQGLSPSDYRISLEYRELRSIIEQGFNRVVDGALFLNFDLRRDANLFYSTPIYCGWLWTLGEEWIPAPSGITNVLHFLEKWSSVTHMPINPNYSSCLNEYLVTLNEIRKSFPTEPVRVAIEGLSWWVIGLAKFLKEELGCKVLISSDEAAYTYQCRYGSVAEVTLVDVGNYELMTYLDLFQPQLVFGSSFVKKGPWNWIPYFQPVWHSIEMDQSLLGPEGAIYIANSIKKGGGIYA